MTDMFFELSKLVRSLDGVRIEVHPHLPCQKDLARIVPKVDGAKREFWHSEDGEVWGFSELVNSTAKIYLSQQMFEKLKTANIG